MYTVKSLGGRPVVINSLPFEIEEKRVLRELRIPRLKYVKELKEEGVAKAIKQAIDAAYTLIHGRACYKTFPIKDVRSDRVILQESETLFIGKNMVKLLARSDYVTLLACTIGSELEKKIDHIKKTHTADAYFLDVVGSWMADYMADKVDAVVQSEVVRNGYARTMRYSPGYGDWDLTVQAELLQLTEAQTIGVGCTETSILQPRKSVTAAIGWERKE
ncbi:MAG TPA: vitamin B12 dependent-methionine synthase activation domain-containing protein [Candidatus Polarisedimenticolia bacterium]|nr:vitamin B12 dependent-methionine synthase activation domain-containing protein [Candidatus Polarisedimenticolia bacterium]